MEIGQEYKRQVNNVLANETEKNFSLFEMTLVNTDNDKSVDFEYMTVADTQELTTPETMEAILYFINTAMLAAIDNFTAFDKYDFTTETKEDKINQCKKNFNNAMILFDTNDKESTIKKLLKLQDDVDFILGNETKENE